MVEENPRRAMLLYRGDSFEIILRPISGTMLGVTDLILVWTAWRALRSRRTARGQTGVTLDECWPLGHCASVSVQASTVPHSSPPCTFSPTAPLHIPSSCA